jgi:2'-5' RNA ligase
MAFIGISLTHDVGRLFSELQIPGNRTDISSLHITLFYLGKNLDIEHLSKAMAAAFEITQQTKPIKIESNEINYFPVNSGSPFPIISMIESPKLLKLRKTLKNLFDERGIFYDNTFKIYRPHITLSFNSEAINRTKIDTISWVSNELVLWGGNNGDNKVSITLPFSLKKNEAILEKCKLKSAKR